MAISAFGGTGKSTLALEYCHRLIEKDRDSIKIRWLNAATSYQLQADLENLAKKLNLDISNRKIDFIIRSIYSKLKELQLDILLVFDNVESYNDIKDFIKDIMIPSNIKMLITTRDNLSNTKIDKIELEPFSLDETKDYMQKNKDFKDEFNRENSNKIIDLSKSTDDDILPIKIELVVSYVNCYIDQKPIDELLNEIVNCKYLDMRIEATLFNNLRLENELAFKLLRICGFLNPDFVDGRKCYSNYIKK